jgi:hypothetical protein
VLLVGTCTLAVCGWRRVEGQCLQEFGDGCVGHFFEFGAWSFATVELVDGQFHVEHLVFNLEVAVRVRRLSHRESLWSTFKWMRRLYKYANMFRGVT